MTQPPPLISLHFLLLLSTPLYNGGITPGKILELEVVLAEFWSILYINNSTLFDCLIGLMLLFSTETKWQIHYQLPQFWPRGFP